ncbi:hypothetical protein BH20ACT24_BH20ACT24_16230 [soil metagenome]
MRKARTAVVLLGVMVPAGVVVGVVQARPHRDATSSSRPSEAVEQEVRGSLAPLPLSFIQNRGRMDEEVSYFVQGSTTSLYFTPGGMTFRLAGDRPPPQGPDDPLTGPITSPPSPGHVLKLDFVGADPVRPVGTERAPGVVSYFTGPEENWLTGVPTFSSITYPDLWPGIDLVYEGTGSSLEYTFHLDPGADPSRIRLRYRGQAA